MLTMPVRDKYAKTRKLLEKVFEVDLEKGERRQKKKVSKQSKRRHVKAVLPLLVLLLLFGCATPQYQLIVDSEWFDDQSLNATVLIEKDDLKSGEIVPFGTGFLVVNYENQNNPIVVTCAHMMHHDKVYVSINASPQTQQYLRGIKKDFITIDDFKWSLVGQRLRCTVWLTDSTYVKDDRLDVAAFLILLPKSVTVVGTNVSFNPTEKRVFGNSRFQYRRDTPLGTEVFFVGFPMNLGVEERLIPLVRSGSIAWRTDDNIDFLIDGVSYGGNSGSPLFTKRKMNRMTFSKDSVSATYSEINLIGMITSHVNADSLTVYVPSDSGKCKTRALELNSGLARGIWVDYIGDIERKASSLKLSR